MAGVVTEAQFQRWITDVAGRFGWRVWHVPAPMRAGRAGQFVGAREAAGLPDLIMLHDDPPRLIFAEVKGEKGKLSAAQQEFLRMSTDVANECVVEAIGRFRHAPVGVHVWRPGDEMAIEAILRSKNVA